jgi:hypothetical protein
MIGMAQPLRALSARIDNILLDFCRWYVPDMFRQELVEMHHVNLTPPPMPRVADGR